MENSRVMVFLASPYIFKVETLDLSESNLTDRSVIAISKSTEIYPTTST